MEHRLLVTSECGVLYYFENDSFYPVYSLEDNSEFFGKIACYKNDLIVIGGYSNIHLLRVVGENKYDITRVGMDVLKHTDAIKFIDNFLVLASSSYNTISFFPVDELYNTASLQELKNYFIMQLYPFIAFKLTSLDFLDNNFIIGLKQYDRKTSESGILRLTKSLEITGTYRYGWNVTKIAVVDGKVWSLCNDVYKTEKMPCLVVDNKKVVIFHETYELNDFSISGSYIYIVGRCVDEECDTTFNRGMIIVLDKSTYELKDTFFISGIGALMGCLSLGTDLVNNNKTYNCTEFIEQYIKEGKPCKIVPIIEGKQE